MVKCIANAVLEELPSRIMKNQLLGSWAERRAWQLVFSLIGIAVPFPAE